MRDYKNIKAYQLADNLVLEIYKLTKIFPKEEVYGLVSQLRRAAVSVPSNIVEGSARQHKKDYLNFLYNSKASLSEVEYLLNLACRLEYFNEFNYQSVEAKLIETAKTLHGLINAVEKEIS